METYTIRIECDNAAFDDDPSVEVVRILRRLADRLEINGLEDVRLMDFNGNHVGDAG